MSQLLQPSRRGFLRGIGALLAAPAIVRASSLMAISPLPGRPSVIGASVVSGPMRVITFHVTAERYVEVIDIQEIRTPLSEVLAA
jgi:hypothetical protein